MSHYLNSVRIKNYRSIVDLELYLSPFTALVGENNTGKSNILNAIQWFVKPDKLDKDHFYDPQSPIEIEGEIIGITDEILNALADSHAGRLRPYVKNQKLVIRRRMESPGAASTAKLEIRDPASGNFDPNPTGIPAAILALFPDPVRVEAMVDAPEDASKNKSTSTLGKLLAKLSEPVERGQGKRLSEIFDEVGKIMSASGQDRAEELLEFDRDASAAVQEFFPGIDLSIHFPPPVLSDLFKSGTVLVKEEGANGHRKFEELGHGAQRSIQMALVQLLASRVRQSQETPRCTLLLIDEPELYLHPQAIEQTRMSLKRLASAGYQVVFSTHSPLLVDSEDMPDASIISKPDVFTGTKANVRVRESVVEVITGDTVKQAQVLFELGNSSEVLFCRRVLLVEGHTEPRVIPSMYGAVKGRTLRADKMGIVQLSGSGDTGKALRVVQAIGISARALVDLDYAFRQAVRTGLVAADHPSRVSVRQWFQTNRDTHKFELDQEGFPTKKSTGGAEGAFRVMSKDPANEAAIQRLHDDLKSQDIWMWKKGSIEQVMGIDLKNNPTAIVSKCLELGTQGSSILAEEAECLAFCDWLCAYPNRGEEFP
jgi:putative ATP-dependent endonuclease of OLD family